MNDPRDIQRWISATEEVTAAAVLLDHADALIDMLTFIHRDSHALTAVMATGAEKLLKLTYGFTIMARNGEWPRLQPFGHRIADLDGMCRGLLRSRLDLATHPHYIGGLLAEVEADPFVRQLLSLLERYAVSGRFYNLDHLGERAQPEPSPSEHWEQISLSIPFDGTSMEDFDAFDQRRRALIRKSLLSWRELYWRAWIHGVCGEDAKRLGWGLQPNR